MCECVRYVSFGNVLSFLFPDVASSTRRTVMCPIEGQQEGDEGGKNESTLATPRKTQTGNRPHPDDFRPLISAFYHYQACLWRPALVLVQLRRFALSFSFEVVL